MDPRELTRPGEAALLATLFVDPLPPTDSASPWSAGQIIGGRYRLVGLLGAGGMGQVWRATHVSLGTDVAVKLVDVGTQGPDGELVSRFLQEARAAAMLQSAHVVQILDHGHEGRIGYIAMELLQGKSLATLIREHGILPNALVAKVFQEMARALRKAHGMGIVHRDLKPDNVFVAEIEGQHVTKILDFGIAKILGAAPGSYHQTNVNVVVGTPVYLSPEQALGNRPVDHLSDLWQLGVIAFECLTGTLPFEADGLGALYMAICSGPVPVPSSRATLPPAVDAWMARALCREPEARFQSATDLAEALRIALGVSLLDMGESARSLPIASVGVSATRHPAAAATMAAPVARHSKRLAVAAGAVAALVVAGAVVYATTSTSRAPASPAESASAPQPEPRATPSAIASAAPTTTPAPTLVAGPSTAPTVLTPRAANHGAQAPLPPARPTAKPKAKDDDLGI